ncbi:MAG: Zn-ribbon containing protein [Halobacteriaceae archaeon]
MPHQCTNCGHTFPDGSKEMLSGCPDCGGNKFQFHKGSVPDEPPEGVEPPPADGEDAGVASAVGRAASTVRDLVGSSDAAAGAPGDTPASPARGPAANEEPTAASTTATDAPADDGTATADEPTAASSPATDDSTDDGTDRDTGLEHVGEFPDQPRHDALVTHSDDDSGSATDDLLEREWPEVSRPDAEDAAQASARSELFGADDDLVEAGADPGAGTDSTAGSSTGPSSGGDLGDITVAPEEPLPEDVPDETEGDEDAGDGSDGTPAPTDDAGPAGERGPRPADVSAGSGPDSPDLAALRRELNDQFESIKIVEKGQYELNLMELYEREEYIISLQEDGRYVIEVPDTWRD